MTGSARDSAYFPEAFWDPDLLRALGGRGKLGEALHTSPDLAGAVTPTGNDAFSRLTVVGGHLAMAILLDDRLRFALAITVHRRQAAPAEA